MAKAVMTSAVDLEPIDRLEEQVKLLVGVIDRLRSERAKAAEDNDRMGRELEALHARLADAEGTGVELNALRQEREVVRSRVAEMLQQIEGLNL
jgi:regulator of replication initiation timing